MFLGTSVIFLKLRGWSIIPLEFVKVDLFNKNPWMVDVRHLKGNIDHPIVLKKKGVLPVTELFSFALLLETQLVIQLSITKK